MTRSCSVPGCGRAFHCRGFCEAHYWRLRKYGDAEFRSKKFADEYFWARVDKRGSTECWPWTAEIARDGYGRVHYRRAAALGARMAHRVAYLLSVGPIPDGLVLDHLCRRRSCCNPLHLEPVRQVENVRRGLNAPKTHCKRGHEFTSENTYLSPDRYGVRRTCRACRRARKRERVDAA